ncbi:MAG: hypothetical protein WB992_04790 [Bryobacteraceae bacterium]
MSEASPATYDPVTDTLTIFGIRYAVGLFEHLGIGPVGRILQIVNRHDETVTLQALTVSDEQLEYVTDLLERAFDEDKACAPNLSDSGVKAVVAMLRVAVGKTDVRNR